MFSTSNGLSVTLNWTPSQISISSFPVSYRISITTVINLSTDIDVQFNADTTETSMTFQSCDLQEPLAIDNKMYYWSIYAIVDNKISSPVKAIGGFTFNRSEFETIIMLMHASRHYNYTENSKKKNLCMHACSSFYLYFYNNLSSIIINFIIIELVHV